MTHSCSMMSTSPSLPQIVKIARGAFVRSDFCITETLSNLEGMFLSLLDVAHPDAPMDDAVKLRLLFVVDCLGHVVELPIMERIIIILSIVKDIFQHIKLTIFKGKPCKCASHCFGHLNV